MKYAFVLFLLCQSTYAAFSDDMSYKGDLSVNFRQFDQDENATNEDQQFALAGSLAIDLERDYDQFFFSSFGRYDSMDHSRNFFNINEAFYKIYAGLWTISTGNHQFNWSVLEIFHPVDSINSRNLDSNAERIERLGQPSIVITKEFESSILQFIPLIDTIAPIVPSEDNRNGPQVSLNNPEFLTDDFESTTNPNMFQWAIRFLKNFSRFDLDLHVARKYDTLNPLIGNAYPNIEQLQATPFYLPVTQMGLAIQGTFKSLIYKLEHINYQFDDYKACLFVNCINYSITKEDHSLTAVGLEYSKVYANDHEGTFFSEYQTILGTTIEQARTLNPFQRDLALGYRHFFNDFDGHEIIAFIINDLDQNKERIYNLSHSFRLSGAWKWHSELRVVEAPHPSDELSLDNFSGLKPISQSDNIFFKLTRFF